MADYKLIGPDETNGVIYTPTNMTVPNAGGNRHWQEYLAWKSEGNVPDPQYTLAEAKIICNNKAQADYEAAINLPYNDGVDDIDCTPRGRQKINTAKQSSKTSVKVKINQGKAKTLTDTELDDLIDAIDDRDDNLLDDLDSTLDAIEAATTIEELAPYMP